MVPGGSRVCDTCPECSARISAANLGKGRRVPAGPSISIIDDDESVRRAIVALVRSAGYDADGFASAEDFLGCETVGRFACIITDIHMPGMSGIELKEHLTASQSLVPVIMITARHDPGLEGKAIASGAACFLRKPFEADALITCLERALRP
jgi:FixJ family two-component response regulator